MQRKLFTLAIAVLLCITGASAQVTDSTTYEENMNGTWQNSSLYITSYDGQCRIATLLGKTWDISLQNWVNNSLSVNKYDDVNGTSEEIVQTWDNNQATWVN